MKRFFPAVLLATLVAVLVARANPLSGKIEKASFARLSADGSTFDRSEGVALFDGHATIDYGADCRLMADQLFVFFRGTNEIDRVVAIGHVTISNEMRRGSCATAVFRRKRRELEMFGDDKGSLARLENGALESIAGSRIRFWLNSEQVEVSDSVLTFDKKKGDLKSL